MSSAAPADGGDGADPGTDDPDGADQDPDNSNPSDGNPGNSPAGDDSEGISAGLGVGLFFVGGLIGVAAAVYMWNRQEDRPTFAPSQSSSLPPPAAPPSAKIAIGKPIQTKNLHGYLLLQC